MTRFMFAVAVWVALGSALTAEESAPTYQPDQHIIVRMAGKPDRRCVVISVKSLPDGLVEYRVKAVDNGEVLMVRDRTGHAAKPPAPGTPASRDAVRSALNADRRTDRPTGPAPQAPPAVAVPAKTAPTPPPPAPAAVSAPKHDPLSIAIPRIPSVSSTPPASDPAPVQSARLPAPTRSNAVPADPVPLDRVAMKSPAMRQGMIEPAPIGFQVPVSAPRGSTAERVIPSIEREHVGKLMEVVKTALQPSHREMAAEELAKSRMAMTAEVRSVLLGAAAGDPAASVRATCVRQLKQIGVKDAAFAAVLAAAKHDPSPKVRAEAE